MVVSYLLTQSSHWSLLSLHCKIYWFHFDQKISKNGDSLNFALLLNVHVVSMNNKKKKKKINICQPCVVSFPTIGASTGTKMSLHVLNKSMWGLAVNPELCCPVCFLMEWEDLKCWVSVRKMDANREMSPGWLITSCTRRSALDPPISLLHLVQPLSPAHTAPPYWPFPTCRLWRKPEDFVSATRGPDSAESPLTERSFDKFAFKTSRWSDNQARQAFTTYI